MSHLCPCKVVYEFLLFLLPPPSPSFSLPPYASSLALFFYPVFFPIYLQKQHFGKLPFLLTLKYEGVPYIIEGSSQAVFNGCLPELSMSAGGSVEAAICPTWACTCFYF